MSPRSRRLLVRAGLLRARPPRRRRPLRSRRPLRTPAPPRGSRTVRMRAATPITVLTWLGLARRVVRIRGPVHERFLRRREQVARQSRRRQRVALTGLAVAAVTAVAIVGLLRSPLLAVEEVRVVGVAPDRVDEVLDTAGVDAGVNLLDVRLGSLESRVAGLPWVRDVVARRLPPSTIEIRVAERAAVAALATDAGTYAVSSDAVVVSRDPPPDLPVIHLPGVSPTPPGQVVEDEGVRAAIAVHRALPGGVRSWVVSYEIDETALRALLEVPTDTGPARLWASFGAPRDVTAKARTLATLVAELVQRGTPVHMIDVRVPGNPVVIPA